jgi:glycosyltransferase involved in cell wall biosynthesis
VALEAFSQVQPNAKPESPFFKSEQNEGVLQFLAQSQKNHIELHNNHCESWRVTLVDIQVIVSDNASSDGTAALLESVHDERLTVLRKAVTVTMVENWNACPESASGEYFLLLSDDDVLEPTAIAEMVTAFESDESMAKRTGFVYCRGRVIDGTGNSLRMGSTAPAYEPAEELMFAFFNSQRALWPRAILHRRSDLRRYADEFTLGTDAALWMGSAARYGGLDSSRTFWSITGNTKT